MDDDNRQPKQPSNQFPQPGSGQLPPVQNNDPPPHRPLPSQIINPTELDQAQSPPPQPQVPNMPNQQYFQGQSPDPATNYQNTYGQYNQKNRSPKKLIIIMIIIGVLLAIGLVAYLTTSRDKTGSNSNNTQTTQAEVTVPSDWQTLDTELGFSIKAPQDWQKSAASDANIEDIESKNISLSSPEDPDSDAVIQYVSISTQRPTNGMTQADFEKTLTDVNATPDEVYSSFGIDKSQVKITSSKLSIGGKEWLRVDTEIPGQFSTAMYLWNGDHAINLTVLAEDQTELDSLVNQYLLPMSASLQLN